MKRITTSLILFLALGFSNVVFAQTATSISGAGASSDATATTNNVINNDTSATATGVGNADSTSSAISGDSNSGASAISGDSNSGASAVSGDSSAISGDSSAFSNTGPSSAEIGAVSPTQTTIISSQAPHIPTPAPNFGFPINPGLQMFAPPTRSYIEAGLVVTDVFESVCPSQAIAGINISQQKLSGGWLDDEVIRFVPHIKHVLHESGKDFVRRAGIIRVGTKGWYKCVGIISATAKPGDALGMSFAALRNQALQLITRDIRGYEEVNIFIASDARVVSNTLGSQGFTLGIGGGGSTAPQSMFIGGASGASYSNTSTGYRGVIGFTAVAFAPTNADEPDAVFVSFVDEKDVKNDPNYTNGVESGKKNVLTQ